MDKKDRPQAYSRGGTSLKKGARPKGSTPKTAAPGQILVIVLLLLVILGLGALIYILLTRDAGLSPGGGANLVIERLEPEKQMEPVPSRSSVKDSTEPGTGNPPEPSPGEKLPKSRMRDVKIYFVKVNGEGMISLKSTNRSVDFAASPLTQSINFLMEGPDSNEINRDALSLIPEGSRLLSARVEEGIAWLNFNEAFRFNPLGREGYTAQLKQIVYTATEFPGVKAVQFLIEGSIKQYLSGEGFYIGEPLSRESF